MDGDPAGQPGQAHGALLAEAEVGVLTDQLPDERGDQHLPRARELGQPRGPHHRRRFRGRARAQLARLHPERRRILRLLQGDGAADRFAGAPEGGGGPHLHPAVARHQLVPWELPLRRQHGVRTVLQDSRLHGSRASLPCGRRPCANELADEIEVGFSNAA